MSDTKTQFDLGRSYIVKPAMVGKAIVYFHSTTGKQVVKTLTKEMSDYDIIEALQGGISNIHFVKAKAAIWYTKEEAAGSFKKEVKRVKLNFVAPKSATKTVKTVNEVVEGKASKTLRLATILLSKGKTLADIEAIISKAKLSKAEVKEYAELFEVESTPEAVAKAIHR